MDPIEFDELIHDGTVCRRIFLSMLNPKVPPAQVDKLSLPENVTAAKFRHMADPIMAAATVAKDSVKLIERFSVAIKEMRSQFCNQESQLIKTQQRVIELQEELLASKTFQLEAMQSTVKTSVQSVGDVVMAELISYSGC